MKGCEATTYTNATTPCVGLRLVYEFTSCLTASHPELAQGLHSPPLGKYRASPKILLASCDQPFCVNTSVPRRCALATKCPKLLTSFLSGLVMGRRWWAGPARQFLVRWATARPGPSNFNLVGRVPVLSVKFSEDGPRPGPPDQIFRRRAAARPIKSSDDGPRPGPAHHIFKKSRLGPVHHIAARHTRHGPIRAGQIITWAGPWIRQAGPCVVPYKQVHVHI